MTSQQLTDEERQEVAAKTEHLQRLADRWRQRLNDPNLQRDISNGVVAVSPLVKELLRAFP